MKTTFLDGRVTLYGGDNREVLRTLADNSIDSIATDPPYALVSIVKRYGSDAAAPARDGDVYARSSAGFMGKKWDTGEVAFAVEFWAECLRVLKPGGHLIAFSHTRTYHRMTVAIEDSGFEIRDQIAWVYGSGFPKSHDLAKAIDRAAGVKGEVAPKGAPVKWMIPGADQVDGGSWIKDNGRTYQPGQYIPVTPEAQHWQGWGTALKPAWEPICLARKPLIGTVAETVLEHGTGALNIDGCRVGQRDKPKITDPKRTSTTYGKIDSDGGKLLPDARWPANLAHDGSDEVVAAFPAEAGASAPASGKTLRGGSTSVARNPMGGLPDGRQPAFHGDSGSAARFFYTSKADDHDRLGSGHPTVKPVDLMQWLVRMVTPKGGTVLDPFAGTGTTGEAAWREGMNAILIEREADYQADIARRMDLADKPTKRQAVAKTKNNLADSSSLPLFGGGE